MCLQGWRRHPGQESRHHALSHCCHRSRSHLFVHTIGTLNIEGIARATMRHIFHQHSSPPLLPLAHPLALITSSRQLQQPSPLPPVKLCQPDIVPSSPLWLEDGKNSQTPNAGEWCHRQRRELTRPVHSALDLCAHRHNAMQNSRWTQLSTMPHCSSHTLRSLNAECQQPTPRRYSCFMLVWPMIVAGVCERTGSNISFSNSEFSWL